MCALWACSTERADESLATLDARFEPVRAAFDADAAHVRILAVLSPT